MMIRVIRFYRGVYLHETKWRMAGREPHWRLPTSLRHVGLLINWRAFWIGWHYGKEARRLCINVLPCVTLYYVRPGGTLP